MKDLVPRLTAFALDQGLQDNATMRDLLLDARDEIERMREALERIDQWSRAYPLDVFPKPDLARARSLLEAGGMTLDSVSADAMRHAIEGVGAIARAALGEEATDAS